MVDLMRRRVVAIFADLVGSTADMAKLGNVVASTQTRARLTSITNAMLAIDPELHRGPVEGDGILLTGDRPVEHTVALFRAAAQYQGAWAAWPDGLDARIAIGEGEIVEDADGLRGQVLNTTARLLKYACRPKGVVVTDAVHEAVAAAGDGARLSQGEVRVPGLGNVSYWFIQSARMPDELESELSTRVVRALERMDARLGTLEQQQAECRRLNEQTRDMITAAQHVVERLTWAFTPVRWLTYGFVILLILALVTIVIVLSVRAAPVRALTDSPPANASVLGPPE